MDLTPVDLARARHRLYALLGELLCRGPVPGAVAVARELPALAPAFSISTEALWAGHQAAVVAALPWESAWLSADGRLGGEVTDGVRAALREGGFVLSLGEEPDHVGIELAYLGHLCAAEAEARADGREREVEALLALSRAFLQGHLGRWLAPFVASVRDAHLPAWTAVAELALELCTSHGGREGEAPWALEALLLKVPLPEPRDPELGLWTIVRTLVTPARSGFLPSARALDRLGEAARVPTGIGDRAGRLELAWRSAGMAGTTGSLFQALDEELAVWARGLGGTPWAQKAEETRAWLCTLRSLDEEQRDGR